MLTSFEVALYLSTAPLLLLAVYHLVKGSPTPERGPIAEYYRAAPRRGWVRPATCT